MKLSLYAILLACCSGAALAAPATYTVDPDHTYPHFEVDHFGGMSVWRGLFKETSGTVVLDREAKIGSVEIVVNTGSVEFGNAKLNEHVVGPKMLDSAKFPVATYTGKLVDFKDGAPTAVDGTFTLHGITHPLVLKINSFKCVQHPIFKREFCGADAIGTFQRDEYGVSAGKDYGFKQDVLLRIQIEALKQD
jgi:polyisoprenoid-binding protein YceI